jgi:hypothetical protein
MLFIGGAAPPVVPATALPAGGHRSACLPLVAGGPGTVAAVLCAGTVVGAVPGGWFAGGLAAPR